MNEAELKKVVSEIQKRVKKTFKELRKQGIATRMNYMCCSTCAIHNATKRYSDKQGVVYFHKQDAAFLRRKGVLYIRYIGMKKETRDIAETTLKELRKAGLKATWDKDIMKAITVEGVIE